MHECGSEDEERDKGERSPSRVYKSEVAAYVAASTMTAVVAAGEEEKQQAAKDLQSLHSAPCEWFVCDDLSTYTRCFVIQVKLNLILYHSKCSMRNMIFRTIQNS